MENIVKKYCEKYPCKVKLRVKINFKIENRQGCQKRGSHAISPFYTVGG